MERLKINNGGRIVRSQQSLDIKREVLMGPRGSQRKFRPLKNDHQVYSQVKFSKLYARGAYIIYYSLSTDYTLIKMITCGCDLAAV